MCGKPVCLYTVNGNFLLKNKKEVEEAEEGKYLKNLNKPSRAQQDVKLHIKELLHSKNR